MGLDITAHEKATLLASHDCSEPWGLECYGLGHVEAEGNWPQSTRGLVIGQWYEGGGRTIRFQAGSYGGYNSVREQLSLAIFGVEPQRIWHHQDLYVDRPFFELINFTDRDGQIGPEAAADLASDFDAHWPTIADRLEDDVYTLSKLRLFSEAFHLAAHTGMVVFH